MEDIKQLFVAVGRDGYIGTFSSKEKLEAVMDSYKGITCFVNTIQAVPGGSQDKVWVIPLGDTRYPIFASNDQELAKKKLIEIQEAELAGSEVETFWEQPIDCVIKSTAIELKARSMAAMAPIRTPEEMEEAEQRDRDTVDQRDRDTVDQRDADSKAGPGLGSKLGSGVVPTGTLDSASSDSASSDSASSDSASSDSASSDSASSDSTSSDSASSDGASSLRRAGSAGPSGDTVAGQHTEKSRTVIGWPPAPYSDDSESGD